ncbi:hypothetical protein BDR22DRAFT_819356 [Usnea florida]
MTAPIESPATQTIATIAFGILATLISIFTAWQGYQIWRRLHEGGRPTGSGLDSRDFTLFNDLFHLRLLIPTKQLGSNSKATPYTHTPTFLSFRQTIHHQQQAHQLSQEKRDLSIRVRHPSQLQLRQLRLCFFFGDWILPARDLVLELNGSNFQCLPH